MRAQLTTVLPSSSNESQNSKEDMALFEEVKNLIGPCSMAEVFRRAMKEFLSRRNPKRNVVSKSTSAAEVKNQTLDGKSRYITKATKFIVRARDGGRCTYETDGKRCSERCGLQFDHVKAFALGGDNSAENLRLRCSAHNQLHAEKIFGREFIKSKIKS